MSCPCRLHVACRSRQCLNGPVKDWPWSTCKQMADHQDISRCSASRLHDYPQYVVSLGSWQDIQKFDIYTPRIEGIEISTPREDGEMPRRRTCPRTGRNQRALCMIWSSYIFICLHLLHCAFSLFLSCFILFCCSSGPCKIHRTSQNTNELLNEWHLKDM